MNIDLADVTLHVDETLDADGLAGFQQRNDRATEIAEIDILRARFRG